MGKMIICVLLEKFGIFRKGTKFAWRIYLHKYNGKLIFILSDNPADATGIGSTNIIIKIHLPAHLRSFYQKWNKTGTLPDHTMFWFENVRKTFTAHCKMLFFCRYLKSGQPCIPLKFFIPPINHGVQLFMDAMTDNSFLMVFKFLKQLCLGVFI